MAWRYSAAAPTAVRAARISTWKSLSDVADRAAPMHVAWQRVLAAPRTLAQQKILDLKIKKTMMLDLEFVLKKVKNKKKSASTSS